MVDAPAAARLTSGRDSHLRADEGLQGLLTLTLTVVLPGRQRPSRNRPAAVRPANTALRTAVSILLIAELSLPEQFGSSIP